MNLVGENSINLLPFQGNIEVIADIADESPPTNKEPIFKAKPLPESTWKKAARVAHLIFSIIIFPYGVLRLVYSGLHHVAGRFVLPIQNNNFKQDEAYQKAKEFLENSVLKAKKVIFKTSDNCKIQGYRINPTQSNGKIIIGFSGNGGYAENSLVKNFGNIELLVEEGYTILFFNYRHIGESDERHPSQENLVQDGEAALQYARDHLGFDEENIVLWGHSLGGGVATQVASHHPKVNLINDRSFRSLPKVVYSWSNPLSKLKGVLLQLLGWTLNSEAAWDKVKGKKVVVYAAEDYVIQANSQLRYSQKVREEEKVQVPDDCGHCDIYGYEKAAEALEKIFPQNISPEVNEMISKGNLQEALKNKLNFKEFKAVVYRMVETWDIVNHR